MQRVRVQRQASKRRSRIVDAPVESKAYDCGAVDRAQEVLDEIDSLIR
jgi:hypothetical protein